MNQPSVFISCVSPEFRQTRSRVADALTRLGYTPVVQEIFGIEPGDLRQVLRDKIDACEGLIQIVGQGYGAEPPTLDAENGRVSYTQFEFLYARSQNKKTWLIFAGDACTRDTSLDRLDLPLPNDPAHPDPASYQAERRALQQAYRDKRRSDGHLYYDATSDTDLDLKVERLRDELAKLRSAFETWQKEVLARLSITKDKIRELRLLADSVKGFWVETYLKKSAHEAVMLELRKELLPDMVQHPWERILELPGPPASEKTIDEIFFETGRALLILGEPGAGKTITLIQLARELLHRFEDDPMQAVPVVLNLSTWQDKHALEDWVEAELKNKYFVSRRLSRVWLESNRLILLLDGLDEAPANSRASCVSAINEFVQHRGLPGIVVCSRRTEYSALPHRLSFRGAVCLQPLTNEQIVDHLNKFESQLAALRQAIQQDKVLAELTQTPLMLSIMSLAYQGVGSDELGTQKGDSVEERRKQIFRLYVEQMFQRKGTASLVFPKEKTIAWLSWLAGKMREHSRSVFLVEELQPSWLGTRAKRVAYGTIVALSLALIFGLIFGLIERRQNYGTFWSILLWSVGPRVGLVILLGVGLGCWSKSLLKNGIMSGSIGGLIFGLIVWVILGPILGTISGLGRAVGSGLVVGLIVALIGGLGAGSLGHITLVETISWEWKQFWKRTIPGSVVGLIVGLIFGLNSGGGLNVGVIFGLILGPILGLGSGLIGGFTDRVMVDKASPNQGINLSGKNSLTAFVVTWLIVGLSSGLTVGLIAGQGSGAPSGPSYWVYFWMFSWIYSGHFDRLYDQLNYWLFCWLGPSLRLSYTPTHKLVDGLLIGLIVALIVGLLVGLIVGLNRGGSAVIKSYALRLILWLKGYTPFKFIKFLDECAKLILLKKVGGGYIFIHRMLLEYFADLNPQSTKGGDVKTGSVGS